jgi:glycosyltransferase involved in cell wall biosynthesis
MNSKTNFGQKVNSDILLSVIIPVFNERDKIEASIKSVQETSFKKEILVIDDGSTDGTREILAGLDHPDIRIVMHEKNQGKGSSVQSGITCANGDVIIIQDADLEYDPSEFNVLLQPILAGRADVVYGSRFAGHGAHRVLYFWHYIGNRFLTLLSNIFTDLNLTDMESGYKVFTQKSLEGITIEENRFGFEPEITAKIARRKLRIYEVPISYYGRTYEEGKKIGWKDGFWAIWCILKYNVFR